MELHLIDGSYHLIVVSNGKQMKFPGLKSTEYTAVRSYLDTISYRGGGYDQKRINKECLEPFSIIKYNLDKNDY